MTIIAILFIFFSSGCVNVGYFQFSKPSDHYWDPGPRTSIEVDARFTLHVQPGNFKGFALIGPVIPFYPLWFNSADLPFFDVILIASLKDPQFSYSLSPNAITLTITDIPPLQPDGYINFSSCDVLLGSTSQELETSATPIFLKEEVTCFLFRFSIRPPTLGRRFTLLFNSIKRGEFPLSPLTVSYGEKIGVWGFGLGGDLGGFGPAVK